MTEENAEEKTRSAQPLGQRLRAKALYPVVYMFLATLVFTAVLVGISRATQARVEANTQIMFERAVLMAVLPDEVNASTPSRQIHKMFTETISPPDESSRGAYRLMKSGEIAAYALPFEGQGFWDVIRGVIGIGADGEIVVGIAFYEQKETPGLGAEIIKPYFCERFMGRKMAAGDRPIGIIPTGRDTSENEVNAITGATQTSTRLERILNQAVNAWRASSPDTKGTGK